MALRASPLKMGSQLYFVQAVEVVLENYRLSPVRALSDLQECSWFPWISVGAGSQTRPLEKAGKQETASSGIQPVSLAFGS